MIVFHLIEFASIYFSLGYLNDITFETLKVTRTQSQPTLETNYLHRFKLHLRCNKQQINKQDLKFGYAFV